MFIRLDSDKPAKVLVGLIRYTPPNEVLANALAVF